MRVRRRAEPMAVPMVRALAGDDLARRKHPLVGLQQAAGNAAVRGAVEAVGPVPSPYKSGSGDLGPAEGGGVRAVLGDTIWRAGKAPELDISGVQLTNGMWRAIPTLGPAGEPHIVAKYPAPDLYKVGRSNSGVIWGWVGDDVSKAVKRGEQDHSDDAALAQQKVYGTVKRVVAAQAKKRFVAKTPEAAEKAVEMAIKRALPKKLRWTSGAAAPVWRDAVVMLMAASVKRDDAGWHSMRSRRATYEEQVLHSSKIGQGDAVVMIVEGGQVGKPEPADFIDAAFKERIEA